MTNESKENLLKILFDEPNESPSTNSGEFFSTGVKQYSVIPEVDEQMYYGEFTIMCYASYLYLFDKDGNKLLQSRITSNNTEYRIKSFTVDTEGNFYAIGYTITDPDEICLFYLNNITIKNPSGNYEIVAKKKYDLKPMLNTLIDNGFWGRYWWRLTKSPYDSSFLFVIDGNKYQAGIKNLAVVQYHVNFEGENNFKYLLAELPKQFAQTSGLFASWGEDFVEGTIANVSSDDSLQGGTQTSVSISKISFDFSNNTISQQLISNVSNYVSAIPGAKNEGIVTDDTIYLFVQTLTNSVYKINIYKYTTSLTSIYETPDSENIQYLYPQYINRQLLMALIIYESSDQKYHVSFNHLIGSTMNTYNLGTINYAYIFYIILNSYNLYNINICGLTGVYVFGESVYNGQPYFSDESVTPETMTLYGAGSTTPIFSRNLYNVTKVGNVITSILQVPYNYLNNEIIGEEKLKSKTNSTIDDSKEEIKKNIYEELYINNIDSFKVYDQNNGSTYNQDSSLELTNNIFNGFENNYKIKKYRINYADGTFENKDIDYSTIQDGIGIITIYINLTKAAKTIQLFDENYIAAFVTIDVSNCDLNKIYQIVQKVKVE